MIKKLIVSILMVTLTYPVGVYGDDNKYKMLEGVVNNAEMELEKVGYDTSKLAQNPMGSSFIVLKPDCKLIYPRNSDLFNVKDFDGIYYIQEIVNQAIDNNGKFIHYTYRWQNKLDPAIQAKLVAVKYIKEKNLIISAADYIYFLDPTKKFSNKTNSLVRSYFVEVNKHGINHPDTIKAYNLLKEYIDTLPDRLKKE